MPGLVWMAFRALALSAAIAAGLLLYERAEAQQRRAEPRPRVDVEATYYRQPQLLERALAEVQPSRAGQPQLYFVGFAGYGAQAVFKREVLAVRQIFDERFGTKGRSLMLINHASTLDDIPLANVTNLDRALQHIGTLMKRDEDVLFLFLTSHGSKHLFSVEMPGFSLNNRTPGTLRNMLDRSGIRKRVVVVSACHSGSFVPLLADAATLVVTAAHADRTSFGCDDKREWTYFGDAFFNRALRQERSFERAFEHASQLISRWEANEKLTPSLPQIAGGEELRSRLAEPAGAKSLPPE
jgi:hypothetical protein